MGKRKKVLYIWGICGILLSNLLGCGKIQNYQDVEERYIVGVVTKSSSSEYWMSVHSGMEAAAEKYGMEIIFLSPDSELKKDVQDKLMKGLIEQEVDALAISPIDSYNIPNYMREIKALGIPTITFDTGFEGSEIPYIGIDNEKIGYELAKILANEIGHKGEVGIVSGSLEQTVHKERVKGFQDYMALEDEITIAFVESGYANLQMSEKKVRTLLEEYPKVKGILATSAVTALGLSSATESQGLKIVTLDEQKDALDALENGRLSALALQSGYEIGYETIQFLDNIRNEEGDMQDHIIEAEILTKENIGEYRRAHETKTYSK